MRHIFLLVILMATACLTALPVGGSGYDDRAQAFETHSAGSVSLETSNYGICRNFLYPAYTGNKFLYIGASWISAKKQRRDVVGRKLYWVAVHPSADSSGVIPEGSEDWQPWMKEVIDTLTTVGFDGDRDLYEMLPAHNPLSYANPYYGQYNNQDNVLVSLLGSPAPRPFAYPDPQGNYCFSIPQGGTFATPGLETLSAYYYDFCPFGTPGDRDLGQSHSSNIHYPLGLAIHRESYAWNLQNYDKMIIFKTTIYNTGTLDTLFDLAISEYVDSDVLPYGTGAEGAADDVSGFIKGTGYEFAYTRDFDGDGGLSTNLIGNKIYLPGFTGNRQAWYWRVGDGPDDANPLNLNYAPRRTVNEKYWLATGRNANETKFTPLRPESPDQMEYEQPSPNDTRFLQTFYGAQPTEANPDPAGRLHLAPGASITYYSTLFAGNSILDLKERSLFIESFFANSLQLGDLTGLTCIPYLQEITVQNGNIFNLDWHSYTDPDHFCVMSKIYDAPASQWNSIQVPGGARSYDLSGLNTNEWYQIKIAAVYNPGPNEVYLESATQLANLSHPNAADDPILPATPLLMNYPNPFRESTSIGYELKGPCQVTLEIFNSRGQKVRTLCREYSAAGSHSLTWDGRDELGLRCGSGIYMAKLSAGNQSSVRRMLLIK
jgi:hypothetical protein